MSETKKGYMRAVISLLFILGYFGMVYVFIAGKAEITDGNTDLVAMLIGVTTKAVIDIVTFYLKNGVDE